MQLIATLSILAAALNVNAVLVPRFLRAPVNTPTLIRTLLVSPRFAPCLQAAGNFDGAEVATAFCGNSNGTWTVPLGGADDQGGAGPVTQLKIFGDKCLDVPDGNDSDGVKLQIWTCSDGNPNQQWQVNADETISWASHNKCIDLTDGDVSLPVVRTQIWTCSKPNFNQAWSFIPPQ